MTSHRKAMTTLVAAAVIGILAAGCGSDDIANTARSASPDTTAAAAEATQATEATSATVGDGTLDPCRLVTAGEAAAVLGSEPGEPTNVMAGKVGACTYRLGDGSAAVQINVEPGAAATFESRTAQMGGESVDGVGDQAQVNGAIGQIAVVQGDVLFAIFVMLPGGVDIDHATLIELGRAAAARL